MSAHRAPPTLPARLLRLLGGAVALSTAASLAMAGTAGAAPKEPKAGKARGHLVLALDGVEVATLPPGQAVKLAVAECADRSATVTVTVDEVRANAPEPFVVCDGVTLASQVEFDEADDDGDVADPVE